MSTPSGKYLNAFNLVPQIGPARLRKILRRFPDLEEGWNASSAGLMSAGLDERIARAVIDKRDSIDPDAEFERLEKEGIRLVFFEDETYPKLLKEISSSPVFLYVKGELVADDFCVGIVGSRKLTDYGQRAADDFSRGLSRHGITLVSGMAYGADTIVHRACLTLGRRTVAVLGSGLDERSIYPSPNRQLAREIEQCGCLLSEYPIGTPPLKQHFPARNRVISGISKGLLVIEASLTSGSLISARFALEQGREVFAVPGSVYSKNSEGANNLIKMGAKAACKLSDILEEFNLGPEIAPAAGIQPESPEEESILARLFRDEPTHVDKLAAAVGIKVAALSSLLTIMEMKGMVKDVGGMRYVKK